MNQDFEDDFLLLLDSDKGIIHKISHAYAATSEDRKDLFQEIILSLRKAYPSFKKNSKISTWIYRLGLYTAITNFRRQKRQLQYEQLKPDNYEESTNSFFNINKTNDIKCCISSYFFEIFYGKSLTLTVIRTATKNVSICLAGSTSARYYLL